MRTDESQARKTVPRLRLRVTAAAESVLRSGHPWLFADSIREQNRAGQAGELAVIYDRKDRFLATGLFDPDSPIRVRLLHVGKPRAIDRDWWSERLTRALEARQGLFDEQTTGFRWINGESDGWPGLVLDRYDRTLVLKLYTAAWLPRLEEIAGLITGRLRPERIVLRLSRNIQECRQAPIWEGGWRNPARAAAGWTGHLPGNGLALRSGRVARAKDRVLPRPAREPAAGGIPGARTRRLERLQLFRRLFALRGARRSPLGDRPRPQRSCPGRRKTQLRPQRSECLRGRLPARTRSSRRI